MSVQSLPCPVLYDNQSQPEQMGFASYSRRTTGKGILVGCASMVCYLYTPTLAHGIVVKVDIGAFVEAVMRGIVGRW
jgi:hypothetical protein